jgi:hypothetical protein
MGNLLYFEDRHAEIPVTRFAPGETVGTFGVIAFVHGNIIPGSFLWSSVMLFADRPRDAGNHTPSNREK